MGRTIRIALAAWTAAFIFFAPVVWAQPAPAALKPAVAAAKVTAPAPAAVAAPAAVPVPPAPPAPPEAIAPFAVPTPSDVTDVGQEPPPPPRPPQTPPPPKVLKVTEMPVLARPDAQPAKRTWINVRIDVTLSDQTGSAAPTKKTISATVMQGGRGQVRSGVSAPILSTTYQPAAGEGVKPGPVQSYSYRDMGLSLDVSGTTIRGNYVRLRLAVEYNPVDEKMADTEGQGAAAWLAQGPASFARFSQTLDLALESGKPLVVASSSDPVPSRNRTASLEVKATILK